MQKLITVLFFTMLLVLGTSSYATASATYSVDMNGYSGSFTTVYISGTFNGWSDFANPLSDEDGDGIWSTIEFIVVVKKYVLLGLLVPLVEKLVLVEILAAEILVAVLKKL